MANNSKINCHREITVIVRYDKMVVGYLVCVYNYIQKTRAEMSFQSGSRFGQNKTYSDGSYYSQNSYMTPNYNPPPFNPQPSQPQSFNPSLPYQQNIASTPPIEGQPLPLSSHLAVFDSLDKSQSSQDLLLMSYDLQERAKLKAENSTKYSLSPQSILYRFYPRHLESIMVQYPNEFPPVLTDSMRQRLASYRRSQDMSHKLVMGGIMYWLLLRRKSWFKLTGNPIFRWTYMYVFVSSLIDASFAETDFLVKQAFINHSEFQNVIRKYNLIPQVSGKLELLTS